MKNKILITLIFLSNFLLTACGAKTAAPKVESTAPVSTDKPAQWMFTSRTFAKKSKAQP
jgi:uncharacterized protein YcfL